MSQLLGFISLMVECNGEPVIANQNLVTKLLFDEMKDILYEIKITDEDITIHDKRPELEKLGLPQVPLRSIRLDPDDSLRRGPCGV